MNSTDDLTWSKDFGKPLTYIESAENEALKRLNRRFPGRDITVGDIKCVSFWDFNNNFGFESTCYMEIIYNQKLYEIKTEDGIHFKSLVLRINKDYQPSQLDKAIQQLSKKLNVSLSPKDILVDSFEEDATFYKFSLMYNSKRYLFELGQNEQSSLRQRSHSS